MSRSFIVLFSLSSLLALCSAAAYAGHKVYEIVPATRAQCDLLHELSTYDDVYDFLVLSKLPGHVARVMVSPTGAQNLEDVLRQQNIEFKVINDDVGETVARDFSRNLMLRSGVQHLSGKGRLSTDRYYSHGEINNYIDDLAKRYPSRAFVKTVGKSYEGRAIKTITIANGDARANKSVILVDGGFHAREWISPAAVLYVIDQLVENYTANADLVLDYDWVILPVANPDGYEYTQSTPGNRFWRKTRKPYKYLGQTCRGADPNRNFGFHWNEEGASSFPCSEIYAGPEAFSEAETIVVRDLMHSLKGRGIMYLTIHSYGNYILYPWGWTEALPENWRDLDEVANAGGDAIFAATGTQYSVGSSTTVLYIAAGGSDDYGMYSGFPIAITMELPGGGTMGFDPPASSIDDFVKETWIGIRAMAEKVEKKYPVA